MQPLVVQPHQCSVVLEDHWAALVLNQNVIRPSAGLLMRCSPSAIVGFVVAVWILSVQRVAGRTWTHVLEKLRRIFGPLCAHGYASATVLRVLLIVWILASGLGMVVGLQFPALTSANAMPMRNGSGGCDFNA